MNESDTVPAPAQARPCGCGRSATGFCVGLHALSAEEWDRMLTEDMDLKEPDQEDDPL